MNWIPLTSEAQLAVIAEKSFTTPQVIFKHSVTCSISKMIFSRLERSESPVGIDIYYLDLLQFRSVSNAVATFFKVHHESPQALVIKAGSCIFDESHHAIVMDELIEQAGL